MKNLEGQKIIVKIGSQVINGGEGLNKEIMAQRIEEMVKLKRAGVQVLLVSSGAVAAGKAMRPDLSPEFFQKSGISSSEAKKMCEQVHFTLGQSKLMQTYAHILDIYGLDPAQGLLTGYDFNSDTALKNMRGPLDYAMRDKGILPIVNANDLTDIEELMISDNDHLTALLAREMVASHAIMLTSQDGVYDKDPSAEDAQLISEVDHQSFKPFMIREGLKTSAGRGGMRSKLKNAIEMAEQGTRVHIANGTREHIVTRVLNDEVRHTLVY